MCNFFFCYYVLKKPSAAEASESVYMRERVKSSVGGKGVTLFPHTTKLQQTTFKTISQKYGNTLCMKEQSTNKVENIVTKAEIAHHEQFPPLPQCFQKMSTAEASESFHVRESVKYQDTNLEDVNRIPFTPPKVERDTNIGIMTHA